MNTKIQTMFYSIKIHQKVYLCLLGILAVSHKQYGSAHPVCSINYYKQQQQQRY
jgi:hypothetical protein